jgi:hypothetical protein
MRTLAGSLVAAALIIAPVAASADVVTITMAALSNNDGATITTIDKFEYGSGFHTYGPGYDQETFYPPAPGLISATITVGPTPGELYVGPTVTYDLTAGGGDVTVTRNASASASNIGAFFDMEGFIAAGTVAYDNTVFDYYLPAGTPLPPGNLDTPYSIGVLTNLSFNDTQIGTGLTCLPGYGVCDPLYGNGTDEVFGLQVSVAPDATPEPAAWALMLSGLALTGLALRRRGGGRNAARA